MIYNWDEENIDIFRGIGEKVKPYTKEELDKIAENEAKEKEAEENMNNICSIIQQNGWRYKKYFDSISINVDRNIEKYFHIKARVREDEYKKLINSLKMVKEFIDNHPVDDIDSRYKLINTVSMSRFITTYNLKIDYGKIKSINIERLSEIIDIDDYDNNKIKSEKPDLFNYLKNNKENFWQLSQIDKKEAKINPKKAELHEDILYEVKDIISKLGDSKIRY